jgi:RsiW-degrading membrane proteinase PrsW (M82 family)
MTNSAGIVKQLSTGEAKTQPLSPYILVKEETIFLGRDPSCQLVLDPLLYNGVSRRHLVIRPIAGTNHWEIHDLDSANGTYLNDKRLSRPLILQPGDRFKLGQNGPEFIFELPPNNPNSSLTSSRDSLTVTQLFPIVSTGKDLITKAFLVPALITIIFVVLMFANIGNPLNFNLLLGLYLAGATYFCVYRLCGKQKPWWLLSASGLMTMLILVSPILDFSIWLFRDILPGGDVARDAGFIPLFISMFFGAGLMEELLKAIPIFAFGWLGNRLRSPLKEKVGVFEPLDAILIGTASAVGFTLLETLGQYVPAIQAEVGNLEGTQLLIPRILGSVFGHMAYSGYFGYFIGLSVLKPRKRWSILITGYLTASLLHALWNATGAYSGILLVIVGIVSYTFLAAAILKARVLSPTRSQNFATRFSNNP